MVNYFSIVNDVENKVTVLYDKKLHDYKWQSFHPMDNHASVSITKDGVAKIKDICGRDENNWQIIDFASGGEAPPAQPKAKPD